MKLYCGGVVKVILMKNIYILNSFKNSIYLGSLILSRFSTVFIHSRFFWHTHLASTDSWTYDQKYTDRGYVGIVEGGGRDDKGAL